MITIKNPEQIEKIATAGKIAQGALQEALKAIKPGMTTLDIEKIAEKYILDNGGEPGFKRVEGYDFTTCINVNDGLVHGIPNDYVLKSGDIVSVDLGVYLDGWNSDLSYTVEVETNTEEEFLAVGKKALEAGIAAFKIGNSLGDIGHAMQTVVENAGYSVSRDLVGHGIGEELHESPFVPGYGTPGKGLKIEEGMVFAIEIIYQKGSPELELLDDDWTLATADGSLAGLFEHTVAATKEGPRILTL